MYEISTIGALGDPAPALVPVDQLAVPPRTEIETVSAPLLATVAVGGVVLGALALWAWSKYA